MLTTQFDLLNAFNVADLLFSRVGEVIQINIDWCQPFLGILHQGKTVSVTKPNAKACNLADIFSVYCSIIALTQGTNGS